MQTVFQNGQSNPEQLIEVDKALESMRDSGFDLSTAAGEIVDNSIEGKATVIRIRTVEDTVFTDPKHKSRLKPTKVIESIAFADNGVGIPLSVLASALKLGYSTRYNHRDGLGRYGVGMKLATISQGRRVDVYTRPLGDTRIYHVYLDLDEISQGEQTSIQAYEVDAYPEEYADLMKKPRDTKGKEELEAFRSGTLVVWSKVDRLIDGGNFGTSIDERVSAFRKFLARAYRKWIDNGVYIELNDARITLHDPLFLLENPRVLKEFGENLRAEVIDRTNEGDIVIDGHSVNIIVTLYPEKFREIKGQGGNPDKAGEQFKHLNIPGNQGHVSILRNGREIYYDIVPRLFPDGVDKVDRFIGVEVSFPAVLDEYFQVRHVKRGAEPVSKLREELRNFLTKPIRRAREKIRAYWQPYSELTEAVQSHEWAQSAVKEVEQTAPQGKGGFDATDEKKDEIIQNVLADLKLDPVLEPEKAEQIKQKIAEQPITLIDASWPGKELFEIEHLNGKAILRYNHRHLFMQKVYGPLKKLATRDPASLGPDEVVHFAERVAVALDVLFMAYAKAENMHAQPEVAYGDLRMEWGKSAHNYVREALKDN